MLDFRDLGLKGVERLPGRFDVIVLLSWERRKSVYSLCLLSTGDIDGLVYQYSTPLQKLILINDNKMIAHLVKDSESRVNSFLIKGYPVKTAKNVRYARSSVVSSCYPSCRSPLHHLHLLD